MPTATATDTTLERLMVRALAEQIRLVRAHMRRQGYDATDLDSYTAKAREVLALAQAKYGEG